MTPRPSVAGPTQPTATHPRAWVMSADTTICAKTTG